MGRALGAFLCVPVAIGAGGVEALDTCKLADLSLEDLMNESVTSVSKKETRLRDAPAAIFVITAEDLRRLGATSVPEALRMVPGMNVARINANEWAVSARGFNSQYADKLLVLVDGRPVYTPTFSGVYWHNQDLMLEDLDRIEVIRGPGATLWGANAVNGVINIISKSARDTQGLLATTAYGTHLEPLSNVRYGGRLGTNLYYRVYGQFLNQTDYPLADGSDPNDRWRSQRAGVRLDWHPADQDLLTLQAEYYSASVGQMYDMPLLTPVAGVDARVRNNSNDGGNVVGRWTRTFSSASEFCLQLYYDSFRHENAETSEQRDTFDLGWQHRFPLFERHDIIWGAGYRYSPALNKSSEAIRWSTDWTYDQLASAFIQDEIQLVPDKLSFTTGSKFEHNDYTGFEFQPSARLRWTATEKQTVWGAVSRAVRTPSRQETSIRYRLDALQPPSSPPIEVSTIPGQDLRAEELIAFELGYRIEATKRLSFDVAGFYNLYETLVNYNRGAPEFAETPPPHLLVPLEPIWNDYGVSYGVELDAEWRVTDAWRLGAGYTWLQLRTHLNENRPAENPEHQAHLRSYLNLTKNLEFNGAAYFVDGIENSLTTGVVEHPAYVRMDLGLVWRPHHRIELSLWGQNLLDNRHSEFSSLQSSSLTEVPRGVYGKLIWRF